MQNNYRLRMLLFLLPFTGLLALPAVAAPGAHLWPMWEAGPESSAAAIDHLAWQQFLDRYVFRRHDGVNLVAYGRVGADDRQLLQSYLRRLSQVDPRDFARPEQLAYWINLYNALTVEVVLAHPGKNSILRMGQGLFSVGPWNDEVITIAGEPVTLNDIEHRILRPIWQDRRVHFALNCASLGCPNLDRQAYTRANSERLLAASESAYINHPRGVRFDDRGRLLVSQIYEWYAADFAADRQGLLEYLSAHHVRLSADLQAYEGRIGYDYDWALNRTGNE